jgi:hypothetical protein
MASSVAAVCPCCDDEHCASKSGLINIYGCEACDIGWEDTWCCACDNDCLDCGTTMNPMLSYGDDVEEPECEQPCGKPLRD